MTESTRSLSVFFLVAFFGLLAVVAFVFFMLGWRPPVATSEGAGIDGVISYLLVVTGIIMLASTPRGDDPASGTTPRRPAWQAGS